jgi:hypothetical protein
MDFATFAANLAANGASMGYFKPSALLALATGVTAWTSAYAATTNDMRTSMAYRSPAALTPARRRRRHSKPSATGCTWSSTSASRIPLPHSKAQPRGVKGCKIYCKVGGPAPTDLSEMTLLDTPSKSSHLAQYTAAQAGQAVYYRGCWVNTHGETGPMSDLVSGTIIG